MVREHVMEGVNGRWRLLARGGAAALLLAPLVAMQCTDEVVWTASDFVFFGALLLIVVGGFEVLLARAANTAYRFAAAVAVGTAFLTMWSNAAIGFFGSEGNPANLLVLGVPAFGVAAAAVARLVPAGMARAMAATAAAQLAVAAVVLLGHIGEPVAPRQAITITAFFALLWLSSALLFAQAARDQENTAVDPRD